MCIRTTSPSSTTNIGTSGNRWPLIDHHRPGRPSRKPGPAPDRVARTPGRPWLGSKPQRRRRAVGQQVHQLGRLRRRPARPDPMTSGARAAELDPGRRGHLEVDPAAGGEPHRRSETGVGPLQVVAVHREHPVRRAGRPDRGGAVVGVDDADADRRRRPARRPARRRSQPLTVGVPSYTCRTASWSTHVAVRRRRGDDQRAEQPALHLRVRDLVRVVPVRADLVGDEPVGVRLPDRHRVLRDAGDAVLGVGDVDAVPVQRHAVRAPTR